MPDMTVHSRPLIAAGNRCRNHVADLVDVAKQAFASGDVATGATAELRSASAADTCVSTWLRTYADAKTTMAALGNKLTATAAAVTSADDDAADLYTGPTVDLPPLTISLGSD